MSGLGKLPISRRIVFLSKSAQIPRLAFETRISDFQRILGRYPPLYRPEPAQIPQPANGFSGAMIWRIETPAGPCALRAMHAATINRQRIAGLHRLLRHIHAFGICPIAVPIATADGPTFFETEGNIWQLEPWLPGSADFSNALTDARLRAALACLARWHLAAARFEARADEHQWFFTTTAGPSPGLAERAGQISRWNESACIILRHRLNSSPWKEFAGLGHEILDSFLQTAPRLAATLNRALATCVPLQPCLRDIWHDHVLFTGDDVTGLIDPHAARTDSVGTDLARLLGSLVGDDRRLWKVGLDAYEAVRPLSFSELSLIEIFDQTTVLLSGMTWLDWHCLQGRAFDNRERVIDRLHVIVTRLKALASR